MLITQLPHPPTLAPELILLNNFILSSDIIKFNINGKSKKLSVGNRNRNFLQQKKKEK